MKKRRKFKILEYTCRRCGGQHPFNRDCPYAMEPPIVPGECRSCATLTNHHDEECELVAIKDQIGLCNFCGDISHLYADCPDQYPNRGPKRVLPRKEGLDRIVSRLTGGTHQSHHHTMMSAPFGDQLDMDMSFVPS